MSSSPRRPGLFQEEDRLPGGWAFLVLGVVVLLTAGGIWWGLVLGRPVGEREGPRSPPRTEGVRERQQVGSVRLTLIGVDSSTRTLQEARRRGLDRWGWIDPAGGLVEIPIDAAMAVIAGRTRERSVSPGPTPAGDAAAPAPPGDEGVPSDSVAPPRPPAGGGSP